ncbi:hypothetical protein [Streptomyces sp. NBC_01465]|uniref:hypothetical protein n=1 Tax=Streptomyces sp. NBC_01465 TaxID=2903878 RepID=UPI002E2F573B|nr:hypothetical protein [Streptomyces sp. NBC_01465]
MSLLAERATSVRFSQSEGAQGPVEVDAPGGSWTAVFTRGDHAADGWLAVYRQVCAGS